jgi:type III secretory pathway component EscU
MVELDIELDQLDAIVVAELLNAHFIIALRNLLHSVFEYLRRFVVFLLRGFAVVAVDLVVG